MKKLFLLLLLFGCRPETKENQAVSSARRINITWVDENLSSGEEEFVVVIVDSCEYLMANFDRSRMITHKGNCKFCKARP